MFHPHHIKLIRHIIRGKVISLRGSPDSLFVSYINSLEYISKLRFLLSLETLSDLGHSSGAYEQVKLKPLVLGHMANEVLFSPHLVVSEKQTQAPQHKRKMERALVAVAVAVAVTVIVITSLYHYHCFCCCYCCCVCAFSSCFFDMLSS